ncbi:MAG: hypothetical protein SNJ70_10345 [Armatimonadota bacterium]
MKKKYIVIYISIIAVALVISISFFKQYLPYLGRSLQPTHSPDILITMENVKVIGISGNNKSWQIKADSLNLAQNRTIVTIKNINDGIVFIDKDRKLKLSSKKIIYDINSKTLRADGGFVITQPDIFTIKGNSVVWTEYNKQLTSQEELTFKNQWTEVTAEKFIADFNTQEYQMWQVKMKADPKQLEQLEEKIQ